MNRRLALATLTVPCLVGLALIGGDENGFPNLVHDNVNVDQPNIDGGDLKNPSAECERLCTSDSRLLKIVLSNDPWHAPVNLPLAVNLITEDEANFDQQMLALLQAGFRGDPSKFDEIVKQCDANLDSNSMKLLATAWKGAALSGASSGLFRAGDWKQGLEKWNEALRLLEAADQEAASPFVKKRIASTCLQVWPHEQDKDRQKAIAKRGIAALATLRQTQSTAWTSLSEAGQLSLLLKGVKAAAAVDDSSSVKVFCDQMLQLDEQHKKTQQALEIVKSGRPLATRGSGERFDHLVRDDFFEGIFNNDQEAFVRAMTLCRDTLKDDPNHYEAMVWLGSGMLYEASDAYESGDESRGKQIWATGMTHMHRACASRPDDVAVLIPRAATLVGIGRVVPMPEEERFALLNLAVYDYEKTLQLQAAYFDQLSSHAKAELLFGLADGWHQLDNQAKANGYFEKVVELDPESEQAELAGLFLNGKGKPELLKHRSCAGCH